MPQLTIERLAYGGSGFGRLDGKACFVPYTAHGDLAEIRIEQNKNSYCIGELDNLLIPSPHRVTAKCPFFGNCGGCNWQHILYSEQCLQKEQIFAETLWRSGRISLEKIKPIISASSPFLYRRRIQLKVNFTKGKLSLGFYRRTSHSVVDIGSRCEIATDPLNLAIPAIRDLICSFKEPERITQVDLSSSSDGLVSALFHYSGRLTDDLVTHLNARRDDFQTIPSASIKLGQKQAIIHVYGSKMLKYNIPSSDGGELGLYYYCDSFSQVNFEQNRTIVELLLNFCKLISPTSVLDLFCGNGNFSLPLAGSVNHVLGFESFEKSVSLAVHNAAENHINNARYLCMDSGKGIDKLLSDCEKFDLVIMDPPRAGADAVAKKLSKSVASYLVYISCDPPTLGRDLSTLQKSGFEVLHVQPVDMFPQTYHLESVSFLKAL